MSARRLKVQHAFTLVETMVALFVITAGMLASAKVFIASGRADVGTQRREVALHRAQLELEKMRDLGYSNLAMSAGPVDSGDPDHKIGVYATIPFALQVGPSTFPTSLDYAPDFKGYERTVYAAGGAVLPSEPFTEQSGGTQVSGTIYRYVTGRSECQHTPGYVPSVECGAKIDNKRILVAAKVNGAARPVWVSSIVSDPSVNGATAVSQGSVENFFPGHGPSSCATGYSATCTATTKLYLFDSQCTADTATQRETQSNHVAHNTASFSVNGEAGRSTWSVCANGAGTSTDPSAPIVAPDLMGTAFPSPDPPSYTNGAGGATADAPHPGASNSADLWSPFTYSTNSPSGACVTNCYTGAGAGGFRMTTSGAPTNPSDPTSCAPNVVNRPWTPTTGATAGVARSATYDTTTVYGAGVDTANRWNVHRWSTNPITSANANALKDLNSPGFDTAAMTLWTKQNATICAKLIERTEYPNGLNGDDRPPFAAERALAWTGADPTTASNGQWAPETLKNWNFTVSTPVTIADPAVSGTTKRLVLAISTLPTSTDDNFKLVYGAPAYPSSLMLTNCGGGKCATKN